VGFERGRHGRRGVPGGADGRGQRGGLIRSQDAVSFRLYQPFRVDEPGNLDKRRRGPDLAEDLAMRARRFLPSTNVGQHDPGTDYVTDGAASLLDGAHHDLEAAKRPRVNIADAAVLPSPSRGAVPDTAIQEPERTARLKPMGASKGEPEEIRW